MALSALLSAGSLWSVEVRGMSWTEGMAFRNEKNVPALVYLGSGNSEFYKRGLSSSARELIEDEKIAFIRLDLNADDIAYPLTGTMGSAIDLGVLLSGAINDMAGRVIMMDRTGRVLPTMRFSNYVHNCDAVIIEDLMRFVIEDRDVVSTPLSSYAKIRRHQLQWKSFFDRLRDKNMTHLLSPINKDDMVYRYKDVKGVIRSIDKFNKTLLLVSQEYGDIERAMITDFNSAYGNKGLMVVIVPEEDIPAVIGEHNEHGNIQLFAFVGPKMAEYPLMYYRYDKDVLKAKGYLPALFYRGLFEAAEDKFIETDGFDINMPIGEYRMAND